MNNENLFVALVFYGIRWCGLFGQNTFFGTRSNLYTFPLSH